MALHTIWEMERQSWHYLLYGRRWEGSRGITYYMGGDGYNNEYPYRDKSRHYLKMDVIIETSLDMFLKMKVIAETSLDLCPKMEVITEMSQDMFLKMEVITETSLDMFLKMKVIIETGLDMSEDGGYY